MADARQLRISNGNFDINDGSIWGQLVEPDPVHILVLDSAIELVISPWDNVDKVEVLIGETSLSTVGGNDAGQDESPLPNFITSS